MIKSLKNTYMQKYSFKSIVTFQKSHKIVNNEIGYYICTSSVYMENDYYYKIIIGFSDQYIYQ